MSGAIQTIQQRTSAQSAGLPGAPSGTTSNGIGEGLQSLAGGVQGLNNAQEKIKELKKQAQESEAANWTTQAYTQATSDWTTNFDERKRTAAPGAPNFTGDFLKDFDEYANKVIGQAPTLDSRQFIQNRMSALRGQLTRESLSFEAQARTKNNEDVGKNFFDTARNELQNRPDNFAQRLAEGRALIDQMNMEAKDRQKLMEYGQKSMAHDAVVGLINRNPYTALKAINSEAGKSGVIAVDALAADDRLTLRNAAQAEIHRREALARQTADRADAIGYRAVGEMDRQIASGIPATPQMWQDWAADVKGTQYESMFKERVAAEQQTQQVLRKPIDEQISYLQEQKAKLDTEGGDMQEAANVQRLERAITQNVKSMQQTPLLYAQNRTGQPVPPVDFSAALEPDGAKSLAATLGARSSIVDGLRKEMGGQVGYKLLLPQEASALASIVESSTPKQVTQLFGTLRNAAGSDAAFASMMQQIAPDSPVRAYAGLLAAKQRQLMVASHVFSPDVVAQSGDVAATLLKGEEQLDPSKQAKGADGQPRKSLYLPDTSELQAQFQDVVGRAFADFPGAAQNAFQAVQAYYVGKAVSTGRLASDKKDIDSALVKEAVTATLGTVVDYNGRGKVIAPWGMDKRQFADAVKQAFAGARGTIAWPDGKPLALDALGLSPAGAGSYYVTAGRGYVMGRSGSPLVLKIGGPVSSAADWSEAPPSRVGRGVDR